MPKAYRKGTALYVPIPDGLRMDTPLGQAEALRRCPREVRGPAESWAFSNEHEEDGQRWAVFIMHTIKTIGG